MLLHQEIIDYLNIIVAIAAGAGWAMNAVLLYRRQKMKAKLKLQNAVVDSTFARLRCLNQAVSELAPKLLPEPPGGHGFTDQTRAILLNLPQPLNFPRPAR
jgi:hypothetical protein